MAEAKMVVTMNVGNYKLSLHFYIFLMNEIIIIFSDVKCVFYITTRTI